MKHYFFNYACLLLLSGLIFGLTACDDNNSPDNGGGEDRDGRTWFNIAMGTDVSGSSGATYVQALDDLSATAGSIEFKGFGFEVPCTRTARVFASEDGKWLYNLDYGGGTITKYAVNGGQSYTQNAKINVSYAIGTEYPRWTKVSETHAMVQNVVTENLQTDAKEYDYTKATIYLVSVEFDNLSMNSVEQFEMPRSEEDLTDNLHVWRIDAPVVSGSKAYVGLNKRGYDANTATNVSKSDYSASTLVVDYPSLSNPKIITSTVGTGSTQGYRTPVAHPDEKGDIYQITAAPSQILKITNGDYDNSYIFDLSAFLGMEVGSNGWFYVGNGIGYVPFYDNIKGSGADAGAWGVARVDLYNKKVVKMNVPSGLWLQQYQYSVTGNDGKFYMALAPTTTAGNIYIFDPASESADGFEKGAVLPLLDSDCTYIGIF